MAIISAFPGKSKPKLQSKTVTPTTSAQNVTADSQYDGLDKVTVNRIPSSYVLPSSTQVSKVWTPGTSNQYIPSGTYLSGQQTIQGDADLLAANIKSGVSIFGVTGTYGGNSFMEIFESADNYREQIMFYSPVFSSLPNRICVAKIIGNTYDDGLTGGFWEKSGETFISILQYGDGETVTYLEDNGVSVVDEGYGSYYILIQLPGEILLRSGRYVLACYWK